MSKKRTPSSAKKSHRNREGTSARRTEEVSLLHPSLMAAVLDNTTESILITDARNRIAAVNPAFTTNMGYDRKEVVGKDLRVLSAGRNDDALFATISKHLAATGRWRGEIWSRRGSGEVVPEWVSITAVQSPADGSVSHVAVFSDIAKRRQDEESIDHHVNYDVLTDLPNNRLIEDRVEQALAQAAQEGTQVGVLYVDLDNFKYVNDKLGNGVGDLALIKVGQRMRACLRDRHAIGRYSGDEFVVFLPAIAIAEEAVMVARRLLEAVSRPMVLKGRQEGIVLTASIGIAVYPDDGQSATELIRSAISAGAHAKKRGRNTYQFYAENLNLRAMERLSLENRLRDALDHDELEVHYQPKVELQGGQVVGMEALVRWESVAQGRVAPTEFIAVAEETGLIVPLGAWVLRTACAQTKAWQDVGLPPLRLAVNVSARQLSEENLLDDIVSILEETGLAPDCLELEITESSLMERAEEAITTLRRLHDMGVHLTADDFGTGYSSLHYLRNFPVDGIKIDRSFVSDIGRGGAMLAAAVVAIGKSLDLNVIAEGVENKRQLDFLRQHQCAEIQGAYFSPPLPAPDFAMLVRKGRHL